MNIAGFIVAIASIVITTVVMTKLDSKWVLVSFFCGGLLGIVVENHIMSSKVSAEDYLKNTEQYQVDTISINGLVDYYKVSKLKQK